MPRNTRDRRDPNLRVIHVTNRCWSGLPFVPNRSMRRALKGVLAKAQNMYSVCICLYLFMGNHYHMIIAGDANRVSDFMGYIDGEIAKRMMRRFPGRWGTAFWQSRFKEQHLVTPEDIINKIGYICCNPLRARLVSKLETYPGASSVSSLLARTHKTAELCSFTFSKYFRPFKSNYISRSADILHAKELQERCSGFYTLETDLFGWTKCFKQPICKEAVLDRVRAAIDSAEQWAESQGVIGADRLMFQALDRPHNPEKTGRTPFLECADKDKRKHYILDYQNFKASCRYAWKLTLDGFAVQWPRGAIVPSMLWYALSPLPSG